MDPNLGFSDPTSRGAGEIGFVYDKLREAELRRNSWVFSIKETILRAIDQNTMLLAAALWSPLTTYFKGSIVADQNGNIWRSNTANNLNNDPLLTTFWEPYFGPVTVSLYASGGSYSAGELVYTTPGDGTYLVYLSLLSSNSDVPGTATPWDAVTTFFKNQVVTRSAVAYMSLIDLNINQDPASAPALWAVGTTYAAAARVGGSDGFIYTSVGSGNLGHDPTLDAGVHWTNTGVLNPWTTVFVGGTGSAKWLLIGGAGSPGGVALTKLDVQYPLGAGPVTQDITRNAFRLPAGFLRAGYQNAKGTTTWLGGPTGNTYRDWDFENGYLISQETGPIRLRFGADVTDVSLMDSMFCEGLAARCAIAIAPTVTQSNADVGEIASEYQKFMSEARAINAIEDGYDDQPDDDYVTVRY